MKNMTYAAALSTAIYNLKDTDPEVAERLSALLATLNKRSGHSDESKARAKEKRANKRLETVSQIIPILRETITKDMTAKEIFEASKERLPEDFTVGKVQNILLREMSTELVKTENGRKANTYRLIERA